MEQVPETMEKFQLCVLATQCGKTFSAITKILSEINADSGRNRSIHFVFTMNTLLNNAQFATRLSVIENKYGYGTVISFASKVCSQYLLVKRKEQLYDLIKAANRASSGVNTFAGLDESILNKVNMPRVVIMCANRIRFDEGADVIEQICKEKLCNRVFIYYDELHKCINDHIRGQIEHLHAMPQVAGIMAMTASPDNIFADYDLWKRFRLMKPDDQFSFEDYSGVLDLAFQVVEPDPLIGCLEHQILEDRILLAYIRKVIGINPKVLSPGIISFIPANNRIANHREVRQLLFELNPDSVVVILNSEEKSITFYRDDTVNGKSVRTRMSLDLACVNTEISSSIAKFVSYQNLHNRPLIITGFTCVGMGQTLMSPELGPFHYGIISHLSLNNDDIYQLVGRLTGRTKSWATYRQTTAYVPDVIRERCIVMEDCSRSIVTAQVEEYITQDKYRGPLKNASPDVYMNTRRNAPPVRKSLGDFAEVPVIIDMPEFVLKMVLDGNYDREQNLRRIMDIANNIFVVREFIDKHADTFRICAINTVTGSLNVYPQIKKNCDTGTRYRTGIKNSEKFTNICVCFLDIIELKLYFIIWYGREAADLYLNE